MKKIKKIYKPQPLLAPKVTFNQQTTKWRQLEMKKRKAYQISYLKTLIFQSLWKDLLVEDVANSHIKSKLQLLKWNLNKYSSISKLKTHCFYIGRSRSVSTKLYMARHTLRKFARFGMLPGFIKDF